MAAKRVLLVSAAVTIIAWISLKCIQHPKETFMPEKHVGGKNVIVTGASSGIGREMALLCCEMGANVYITARREHFLKQVIEECKGRGRQGAKFGYVRADMEDMEQAANVVLESAKALGGIDYLILNHALIEPVPMFHPMDEDGFMFLQKNMDVNFFSFVKMTQTAMPFLLETSGRIGVVSSINGEVPNILIKEYSASKFALNGFYGSLDVEFYSRNMNVSSTVAVIGYIDTEALERFLRGLDLLGGSHFVTSGFPIYHPKECAYSIIKSTALREPVMYFPNKFYLWGGSIMKKLFLSHFRDSSKAMLTP